MLQVARLYKNDFQTLVNIKIAQGALQPMAQAELNTKQIRNSLGETQVIAVVFSFVCFFNISPGDSQCLAKFEN